MKIRTFATLVFALALSSFPALAQVRQYGTVTPGHATRWNSDGIVQDAGTAASGSLNTLGITATGTPFCINDAASTGAYHQLCLGANSLGGGILSYNAYGGASSLPLQINVNGSTATIGTGTVNAGTLGQTSYYAAAGSTLSGTSALILSGTTATLSPSGLLTIAPSIAGTLNNLVIGGSTPLAGTFTALRASTSFVLNSSGTLTSTSGNGTSLVTTTGSQTSGNCVSIDANGNHIASGSPCTSGGIINTGTGNQLTYYATTGTTLSGLTSGNNGVLVTSGGGVPSISSTLPSGLTITSPALSGTVTGNNTVPLTILSQIATNTVLGNSTSGTANVTAMSVGTCSTSASALIWTTNTGFGCNTAVNAAQLGGATFSAPGAIGGGTPAAGTFTALVANTSFKLASSSTITTVSGTGTTLASATGTLTNGHCVSIDASGNFIDAGGACTTGGGGGTVSSALINQSAYYAAAGTVVSGTSAILLSGTTATINPSSASTMNNVVIGGSTPLAATFTTATVNTSLTLNGSTAMTSATGNGAKLVTSTGAQTSGNCVSIDANGNHIASGGACASGNITWTDAPKTTSFSATANTAYCIDTATTGAVTMTLPGSPSAGDQIRFIDCKSNFATTAFTIARNGNKLMGVTSDMTVNTNNAAATLVYDTTLTDWRMY